MATKTIDVSLASIRNTNDFKVSPAGVINAQSVRAVDDEQIFDSQNLFLRPDRDHPLHPSGALFIPPGQSLTYNVTRRLQISHFDAESTGALNQMLIFRRELTERMVVDSEPDDVSYQGNLNHRVLFDEINGFREVTVDYTAIHGDVRAKILVTYTVNRVA
ncbi:hypothetical protein ACBR40_26905 [Nonomuraea sp. AD125B]|uniref:hypothetical protein n=1 Tax=Nonomuraea TaxID=83681 RepID=UPI0031DE34B7